MCLIVFSYRDHPEYPLIFAGNRDEMHSRPALPAHFWSDSPDLLAGRDKKAGGTWLGVTRSGRFATVTNFREPGEHRPDALSRGALVTDFLLGDADAAEFLEDVESRGHHYNGFNLILGTASRLHYLSNRDGGPRRLEPGVYGLSNGWLDTPWPKVRRAKTLLRQAAAPATALNPDTLLDLLRDEWRPSDEELPKTGLSLEIERRASAIFIADPVYGTRASTVVLIDRRGQVVFSERTYDAGGVCVGTKTYTFEIEPNSKSDASTT